MWFSKVAACVEQRLGVARSDLFLYLAINAGIALALSRLCFGACAIGSGSEYCFGGLVVGLLLNAVPILALKAEAYFAP